MEQHICLEDRPVFTGRGVLLGKVPLILILIVMTNVDILISKAENSSKLVPSPGVGFIF
jgi:hypothetical protein